jgi:holo-[acyl-carrier protein] synthase
MIFGIGTDIVHVPRMASLLQKHGNKFAERILCEQEYQQFLASVNQATFLAKRFAAKEAVAKAMGTGFRDGLSLKHISVCNNELGRPDIRLEHRAASLAEELKLGKLFLSLSDEQEYALAFVTIMEQ